MPLVPTRNAAPTTRTVEDRAMVLLSTHAVRDVDGRLIGLLRGGVLLNRNLPFIDHINAIVYPEGSLPFGSRGTATLFLDDVRISTNVRLFGTERADRAIGTRVSRRVRDAVLGRGTTWLRPRVRRQRLVRLGLPAADRQRRARASACSTSASSSGRSRWLKYGMLAGIGALFSGVMIVAAIVSLRWAGAIFRPLEQMEATMQPRARPAPWTRASDR